MALYIIFKNGVVAVLTLESDSQIKDKLVYNVDGLPAGTLLELGYFIKMDNTLLFVNNKFAISVTKSSAKVLPGYRPMTEFESVVALENGTFATLETTKGISIFYFNGKEVVFVEQIKPTQIVAKGGVELKDIIYWR